MQNDLFTIELPIRCRDLLFRAEAPPRLRAHLTLVHDVACRLIDEFDAAFPEFGCDFEAVRFGAATHDIGKAFHREELVRPGQCHEREGEKLLLEFGVPPELARFARTHGEWRLDPNPTTEDLLVALADSIWKGKRDDILETLLLERIGEPTGLESWAVFERLDRILSGIAQDADRRLDWQKGFMVE